VFVSCVRTVFAFHYRIVGPYVFPALVTVHAGAALHHHFVQNDEVLRRMLPGK
jgi:cytochrome b561